MNIQSLRSASLRFGELYGIKGLALPEEQFEQAYEKVGDRYINISPRPYFKLLQSGEDVLVLTDKPGPTNLDVGLLEEVLEQFLKRRLNQDVQTNIIKQMVTKLFAQKLQRENTLDIKSYDPVLKLIS